MNLIYPEKSALYICDSSGGMVVSYKNAPIFLDHVVKMYKNSSGFLFSNKIYIYSICFVFINGQLELWYFEKENERDNCFQNVLLKFGYKIGCV